MNEFYTLLTNYGIAKIVEARANKQTIKLSYIAVGDGEIVPSEEMTELKSQKHRLAINSIIQDSTNPNYLVIEGVIPVSVGGFYINEVGIYDENEGLFAIGNLPKTYKPLLSEGSAKELSLKIILEVSNAKEITLKVDNSIVLATREWVTSDFYTKEQSDGKFALKKEVQDSMKIGAYMLWSSQSNIPAGFLLCDGRALKKVEYQELFRLIGYTYGGEGENFHIPTFNDGRFMRSTGGNALALGKLQESANLKHSHGLRPNSPTAGNGNKGTPGTGNMFDPSGKPFNSVGVNISYEGEDEARPLNSSVVVLIKAKNTKEIVSIDNTPYATQAKAGIVRLKNQITALEQNATLSEKAVVDGLNSTEEKMLGLNQEWYNLTDDRKIDVVYTNTTGKPIQVVLVYGSSNNSHFLINGKVAGLFSPIIPAGATYQLKTSGITSLKWYELR